MPHWGVSNDTTYILWRNKNTIRLHWAKKCLRTCRQQRPKSACAFVQSDHGICCPLAELLDTKECMNGEQRPRWYFVRALDDLNSEHPGLAQSIIQAFVQVQRHLFAWHDLYILWRNKNIIYLYCLLILCYVNTCVSNIYPFLLSGLFYHSSLDRANFNSRVYG